MKAVSLTVTGFTGIRDGLGRDAIELDFEQLCGDAQLVALAGPNGRGKTTIIDNAHPYPVMPSRAGADGLGSFSYYDHVYLPESVKDLVWEYAGVRYRTQMVLRTNGKKKTEAFLHQRSGSGWEPVRLADGTLSDGKMDTYLRCVEAILGSAQTFFTSVFSAQGKRQLSAFRNAEIKRLLADLLGLEQIRAIGAKAAETAKLIKVGLTGLRQELEGHQAEANRIAQQRTALGDTQATLAASEQAKVRAQATLDAAKEVLAKLIAAREGVAQTEARRAQLAAERKAALDAGKSVIGALHEQDKREAARLARLDRGIVQRSAAARMKVQSLEQQRAKLQRTLEFQAEIARAKRHIAAARDVVAQREARLTGARIEVQRLDAAIADEKLAVQRLAAIEREAGQAALKAKELSRRFGLTEQVPCSGTDLQQRCQLLGDAREAKTVMPSAQTQIARLDTERVGIAEQLRSIRAELVHLQQARTTLHVAEAKLARSREHESKLALTAARQGELDQAREALAGVVLDLDALAKHGEAETDEERTERAAIAQARRRIADQREVRAKQQRESLDRIERALAALPPAFDASQIQAARKAVERGQKAQEDADKAFVSALREHQSALEADQRAEALRARIGQSESCAREVETQLGVWNLFAKCMSNDGVIALAIDDAGPTLSGLANDLLLACYGPRFTVSIKTLVETAKGEAREGFDIVVHDAESGYIYIARASR